MKGFLTRSSLVVGTAIFAAATIDPAIEAISNSGAFGVGSFTDRSNADVIPALLVAACLMALGAALAWRRIAGRPSPAWLLNVRASLDGISTRRLVPFVIAAQLGALFSMETLEQIFVTHHYMGGCVWLGAPPAIALILHAIGGVLTTFLLTHLLRRTSAVFEDAVQFLLDVLARGPQAWHLRRSGAAGSVIYVQAHVRLFLGRAPPLPIV
jgi:hypothetical protein